MKLSRIYSNIDDKFLPINFNSGFNVIVGKIHNPTDLKKDAHNLGKSKLAELIDYCLLKGRSKEFFLFKFFEIFKSFEFYLEVSLKTGGFVTIKRSVSNNSKISLKRHSERMQNFNGLHKSQWDHFEIPISKAKVILDAYLDLSVLKVWDYRDAIAYCLRSQDDYSEIFKLDQFRGRHISWKPYLGHMLGFNPEPLIKNYELKSELDSLSDKIDEVKQTIGAAQGDQEEVLNGHLTAQKNLAEKLSWQLDNLNFNSTDSAYIEQVAGEIDGELEELNKAKYYMSARLRKLQKTYHLGDGKLDVDSVAQLFKEAGVVFGDQIKRSYEELVEFNRRITYERREFIEQQVKELEDGIHEINGKAIHLHAEKSQKLSYLNSHGVFSKYKEVSNNLSEIKVSISDIEKKLLATIELKDMEDSYRDLARTKTNIVDLIRENRDSVVNAPHGVYKAIKDYFVSFVLDVLDKSGIITTEQNGEGNLDYFAGIIGVDGTITGECDGHSYKKMLCIGFDLAVVSAYAHEKFIRFIYHDGGLETLDDRKKLEFIEFVRTASNIHGFQYFLTVIESDLPAGFKFSENEVVRVLHDDGPSGRLFNIPTW
jgi:uncharacterized protein YydD (DUF2326 family)